MSSDWNNWVSPRSWPAAASCCSAGVSAGRAAVQAAAGTAGLAAGLVFAAGRRLAVKLSAAQSDM